MSPQQSGGGFAALVDEYRRNTPLPGLPAAPPGFSAPGGPAAHSAGLTAPLPPAPPSPTKAPSLWDKEHRRDTLLGIGAGFLSGFNFQDGLGAAVNSLRGSSQALKSERKQQAQFGGPDDSFEIITDPRTGNRTVRPVPEFQEYLEKKRIKPKDVADINGRVLFALEQLPPEQRAQAYQSIRANPDFYGVDPSTLPAEYDPTHAAITAGVGMTVSQALTRQRADENADALADYRAGVQADRERRTGIYADRSDALTRQGEQRIGQSQQRITISRAKGSGSKSPAGDQYEYRIGADGRLQRRRK